MDSGRTMFTAPPQDGDQPPVGSSSSSTRARIPSFSSKQHQGGHKASYSSLSHENETSPDGTHVDPNESAYEMNAYPPKQKDDGWYQPPQPSYTQPLEEPGTDGADMTATDSEDEFNWDEDDQAEKDKADEGMPTGMGKHRARRGRRVRLSNTAYVSEDSIGADLQPGSFIWRSSCTCGSCRFPAGSGRS